MGMNNKYFAGLRIKKIKDSKKEILFSELLSLLSSGLDFSSAFELLINVEKATDMQKTIKGLYDDVVFGYSLAQALEKSNKFASLDIGVIKVGEETGRLNEALEFLTGYYNKKISQNRMVRSAVSYPAVILCVAIVVVIFMLTVIVPMFEQVYARMGSELPGITRSIISVSQKLPVHLAVISLIISIAGIFLYINRKSSAVRSFTTSGLLKLPIVGNILKHNYQTHFCKLLYLITSSGIPLLYGIGMLRQIITFYPYQCSFDRIAEGINRGESFAVILERYPKLYDKKLVTLIRVGEETNRLPQMLQKQGDTLTKELEYNLKQLGTMLEPVLILFIGGLVAVIMVSMYLPMFKMGGIGM